MLKLSKTMKLVPIRVSVITDKGATCPRCGGTNTDKENDIWYCHYCQKEFRPV